MGLMFLSITTAVIVAIAIYYAYIWYIIEPEIRKYGLGAPERRLVSCVPFDQGTCCASDTC